ncbi:Lsr2 family protein [uncultured Friedmanniella sp.]|uniref:histone-like nucleoid-structuring protein Lsr2 n=1 Tax=uncultured Friedmanniella sp. TaxID=335381 RepID=UPI0035C98061
MGSRTTVTLFDDLDGSTEEIRTVSLSLDGQAVELDLSQKNFEKVSEFLQPYMAAGRKSGGSSAARRTRTSSPAPTKSGIDTQAVREWAKAQGHKVSDRGRVSGDIVSAYEAAH